MKTIDMLAKACAPVEDAQNTGGTPDLSKLSNEVIDRIADAVITKLSTAQGSQQTDSDPDPESETESDADAEGGELNE